MRVPGSSARKLRCTAGSEAATIVARTHLGDVGAELELGPAGDHDVDLVLAGVGFIVGGVDALAGVADDRVHPERGHAERRVQRLPAAIGGGRDGLCGEIDDRHVGPFGVGSVIRTG
jgi:hypothetical protein